MATRYLATLSRLALVFAATSAFLLLLGNSGTSTLSPLGNDTSPAQSIDLLQNVTRLIARSDLDRYCCTFIGTCGWGPEFCGDNCISNCTATLECGPFANPPGRPCPLGACCSQFGFCTTDVRVCDAQQEMQCHFAPEPYGPCADPTFDQDRRRDEAWFGKVQPFPIPELPELFRYSYLIREAWDVVKANTFQQGQAIGECLWPVPPGTVAYTCAWSVCLVDGFCTDDDALNGSDLDFFREVGLFERGSCDIKVLFSDGTPLSLSAANYPSVGTLMVGKNGAQVVKKAFSYEDPNDCGNPNIIALDPKLTGTLGYVTEHILELQTVRDYLTAKEKGVLPSGALFKVGKTSSAFFVGPFMQDSLSANVPKVFSYNIRTSRKPVQRIFEAFGSSTARVNFVMTIVDVNSVKALLWDGKDPQQIIKFNDALNAYIKSNGDPSNFLNFLRATVAVFLYLDDVAVNKRLWNQVNIVKKQWGLMDNQLSARGANDLAEGWDEFIDDYFETLVARAQSWTTQRAQQIRNAIVRAQAQPGGGPRGSVKVLSDLQKLEDRMDKMEIRQR